MLTFPGYKLLTIFALGLLPLAGCTTMPTAIPPGFQLPVATLATKTVAIATAATPLTVSGVTTETVTSTEQAPAPLPALPTASSDKMLRLYGMVTLPPTLTGLANAHDGVVSGAPVLVTDVITGRHIGKGVTYFDGSYEAEVPAVVGKRPVVLEVMLVDSASKLSLFPLEAAVELAPELTEQRINIAPSSTAWVALLYNLAARQNKAPTPDWTKLSPGRTAMTLGSMIAGSGQDAQMSFTTLTAGSLGTSSSAQQLRAAIDGVVTRLIAQ